MLNEWYQGTGESKDGKPEMGNEHLLFKQCYKMKTNHREQKAENSHYVVLLAEKDCRAVCLP